MGDCCLSKSSRMDLEGIVCKRKDSPYKVTEKASRYWIKVKNSGYSQMEGREELFERVLRGTSTVHVNLIRKPSEYQPRIDSKSGPCVIAAQLRARSWFACSCGN